jgi:hypothetical protein
MWMRRRGKCVHREETLCEMCVMTGEPDDSSSFPASPIVYMVQVAGADEKDFEGLDIIFH